MVMPLLEGWPTKDKDAPSPHEVRLTPLDTNPSGHGQIWVCPFRSQDSVIFSISRMKE